MLVETALSDGEGIPAEMIANTENRVECLRMVKSEVDTQMIQILERVQNVKIIIKENLSSLENPYGVLTRQEQVQLGCLISRLVRRTD